jgi:hypothetical protein
VHQVFNEARGVGVKAVVKCHGLVFNGGRNGFIGAVWAVAKKQ